MNSGGDKKDDVDGDNNGHDCKKTLVQVTP